MPGNKVFRAIAHDIAASFVSRNNDVGGYWAIGKLLSLVQENHVDTFKLDLITGEMFPASEAFRLMASYYGRMLMLQLKIHKRSRNTVCEAIVSLSFDFDKGGDNLEYLAVGEHPCLCRVQIVDTRNRSHVAEAKSWAHAHDPTREQCSISIERNVGIPYN